MTCKCKPTSPFLWRNDTRPSIFMQDVMFRAKVTDRLTPSQAATAAVEKQRQNGVMAGSMYNIGANTKEKEQAMLAYKQFGIHKRAKPNVKPTLNKHESP